MEVEADLMRLRAAWTMWQVAERKYNEAKSIRDAALAAYLSLKPKEETNAS